MNVTLELPPAANSTAWHVLRVQYEDMSTLFGWWCESAGFVRTFVALAAEDAGIESPTTLAEV